MLPIPTSAAPIAVKNASSVNYPQASSGGVFRLAGAGVTTNFALRFSGEMTQHSLFVLPGLASTDRPICR